MGVIDHFGATPRTIVDAIITELSVLKCLNGGAAAGGTGVLKTLRRLQGTPTDIEDISRTVLSGFPAMLVYHSFGNFTSIGTNKRKFKQDLTVAILCIAASLESRDLRATDALATSPGVEDLIDLATYYGSRAIFGIAGAGLKGISQQWIDFRPDQYKAQVVFMVSRDFDSYSDEPDEIFESLGIVHDPLDYDQLWTDEVVDPPDPGETPNSSLPSTVNGGVTEL